MLIDKCEALKDAGVKPDAEVFCAGYVVQWVQANLNSNKVELIQTGQQSPHHRPS